MNILLAKGSRGSQVKKLQEKLNKILSVDLTIDGIFDIVQILQSGTTKE